ncbi:MULTISPECIES: flagellar basal-body rod protein FlgG [unclassified Aminobacter]|uniref:flagellar basal-body rod protein FlgG n=1 Tax=unclassified Aminobacter TaxID=2644704 RepID=UPI000466E11E|nr:MULTISPECIES: flagellar basal-body rod protein FlgG [unclassified Aminobacter]TWG49353.1 flagellar basal-body rod protein FlgG [Aminobacter sp. J44]TWH23402.1 flagellar basal-body rod protein FlgG [Aminobacter sp. J15]
MKALAIAATGMNAQQTNLEVIANNIANINTTGYKRTRVEFSDLLYQVERSQGVPSRANQNMVPEGAHIGLGVKLTAVRSVHTQGTLNQTGSAYDVALTGSGWFRIQGADGEELYTRSGAFNTNAEGVLVTPSGYTVLSDAGEIVIDENAIKVTINQSGQVYQTLAGDDGAEQEILIGQLALATFVNDAGLEPLGDNLFRATTASGEANQGFAGDAGFGLIEQGYLESSNVDPVKEITEMITAQRAYEMNSKVIKAADEMASVITQSIR